MEQVNIDKELSIISNAVEHYNLDSVYSLFSGGTDSLAATYVASHHPLFKGVIHLDTGIGIPDVQEYVIQVCKSQGWELKIYKAMEYRKKNGELAPQNYDDFVRRYGFPGPVNHRVMYSRLKEYPLQQANRDIKSMFKSPAFVTGIRIAESARRAKNYASNFSGGGYDKHNSKVWINPVTFSLLQRKRMQRASPTDYILKTLLPDAGFERFIVSKMPTPTFKYFSILEACFLFVSFYSRLGNG